MTRAPRPRRARTLSLFVTLAIVLAGLGAPPATPTIAQAQLADEEGRRLHAGSAEGFNPAAAAPLSLSNLMAEGTLDHPLQDDLRLLSLDELAVVWDAREQGPIVRSAGLAGSEPRAERPGSYDLADPTSLEEWTNEDLGGIRGHSSMEVVVADLEGDGRPERIIAFQEGTLGGRVGLSVTGLDAAGDKQSRLIDTGLPLTLDGSLRLTAGHFLDVEREQLMLVTVNNSWSGVHVHLLDPGGTSPGEALRVIPLDELAPLGGPRGFSVAAGDLDGDALDEVALVTTAADRLMALWLIDVDPETAMLRVARRDEDTVGDRVRLRSIDVVTGDFQRSGKDDLFVSYVRHFPGVEGYDYDNGVVSKLIRVDREFGLSYGGYPVELFPSESSLLDLAAGDVNGDGRDEIVLAVARRGRDAQLVLYEPTPREDGGYTVEHFGGSYLGYFQAEWDARVVAADLDRDALAEFAVLASDRQGRTLTLFEVQPERGFLQKGKTTIAPDVGRIALAAGPLTGHTVRLGTPRTYRERGVAQILAVINAPPTHYDVLDDGTVIRVNVCDDPEQDALCDTRARYRVETEQSELTVEVQRSWTLSEDTTEDVQAPAVPSILDWIYERVEDRATLPEDLEDPEVLLEYLLEQMTLAKLGLAHEILALIDMLRTGNNVNGSHVADTISKRYGEHFERREERIESIAISKEIRAGRDDFIIRSVTDYDVWEYPLLVDGKGASPTESGHLLVVWPHCEGDGVCEASTEEIVPGTSADSGYAPAHEPLNVLSYAVGAPANYLTHNRIAQLDRLEVGGGASTQTITTERIRASSGTERREQTLTNVHEVQQGGEEGSTTLEVNAGVNLGIFQIGGAASETKDYKRPYLRSSLSGEYGSERVSTHELKIGERTTIELRAGALNWQGQGEPPPNAETRFPYVIQPYVYWSSGLRALTVDYATEPQVVEGNGWDTYYNRPDPAFNLPWKLGRESEALRQRSKQITFDPPYPAVGAPVTVTALVHNYGLADLEGAVEVGLYQPSDYAWTIGEEGLLQGVFVSAGHAPETIATLPVPGGAGHSAHPAADGQRVLVANDAGVRTINVGLPDAPVLDLTARYESPAPVLDLAVDENDGRAYAAMGEMGVAILSLPLGGDALGIGGRSGQDGLPPGSARGLAIGNCYDSAGRLPRCVLIAQGPGPAPGDRGGGLLILDVDDPANPRPMSHLPLPAAAHQVTLAGGHAYIAADDGLHVIDVTLGDNPRAAGFLPASAPLPDVAIMGGFAYLAAGPAGLLVADVSNPRSPLAVGGAAEPRNAQAVALSPAGDLATVSGSEGTFRYDLAEDPSRPAPNGWVSSTGATLRLAADVATWHRESPRRIHAAPIELTELGSRKTYAVRVPWTAPALGRQRLYARIDPNLALPRRGVREVQRGNNLAYAELRTCPAGPAGYRCRGELPEPGTIVPPDLALRAPVAGSEAHFLGRPVPLSVEVLALAGDHENVGVSFYAGDPSADGSLIGRTATAALSVGHRSRAHLTWDTTGLEPGTVQVWAVVDPQPGEVATADNQLRFEVTITTAAGQPTPRPSATALPAPSATASPRPIASPTPLSSPTSDPATATTTPATSATPAASATVAPTQIGPIEPQPLRPTIYLPLARRD